MSGSQALEVAIGLVLMLFMLSLVASSAVEVLSQLLRKRAKDLAGIIDKMVGEPNDSTVPTVTGTTTYEMLQIASNRQPSYLSARAFGDAVMEIVGTARTGAANAQAMYERLPSGLQKKLRPLLLSAQGDLIAIRAEVEGWFDQTMDRLGGAYKRWSQVVLFCIGLFLAVAANASVFGVAAKLWHDPVTRASVAQAAGQLVAEPSAGQPAANLKEVASQVDDLDEVGLPLGWSGPNPAGKGIGVAGYVLGWLGTALLVMLGAPFWFDLLTRLVSLRSAGKKPAPAGEDPGSATTRMLQQGTGPSPGDGPEREGAVSFGAPVGGGPAPLTPEERLYLAMPA